MSTRGLHDAAVSTNSWFTRARNAGRLSPGRGPSIGWPSLAPDSFLM